MSLKITRRDDRYSALSHPREGSLARFRLRGVQALLIGAHSTSGTKKRAIGCGDYWRSFQAPSQTLAMRRTDAQVGAAMGNAQYGRPLLPTITPRCEAKSMGSLGLVCEADGASAYWR